MVTAPQRYAVQLHAQPGGGEAAHQQFLVAQLLAGPHRQMVRAPRERQHLPGQRCLRGGRLSRHQQPLVGLRQASGDGAVGSGFLGLACFTWKGDKSNLTFSSRMDSQAKYLRAASSRSCNLVLSATRKTRRCDRGGACCRAIPGSLWPPFPPVVVTFAVGMVHPQHHQARVQIVGHVLPGLWQGKNVAEVAHLAQIFAQTPVQLRHHLARGA